MNAKNYMLILPRSSPEERKRTRPLPRNGAVVIKIVLSLSKHMEPTSRLASQMINGQLKSSKKNHESILYFLHMSETFKKSLLFVTTCI